MRAHPLKFRHDVMRQTLCFLLGHRWLCSWRRVSDRPNKRRQRLTGNPYCEYVASWHFKCRRCRLRCARDRFDPWFKVAWWSWKNFWTSFGIMFGCYWKGYDWRVRLLLPVAAAAFGIEQGWSQWSLDRGWPFWPVELATELTHRFSEWAEARHPKPPETQKRTRGRWILEPTSQTTTGNSGTSLMLNFRFIA